MIYFLQRADGAIKIGTTENYHMRLSRLEREYGSLSLLGLMDGSVPIERELHARFASKRLNHEWFADCQNIRELIAAEAHLQVPERYATYVQVDNRVNETLKILKEVTDARSMSDVIAQVLEQHYPEAIKAAEERMQATNVLKAKIKGHP